MIATRDPGTKTDQDRPGPTRTNQDRTRIKKISKKSGRTDLAVSGSLVVMTTCHLKGYTDVGDKVTSMLVTCVGDKFEMLMTDLIH